MARHATRRESRFRRLAAASRAAQSEERGGIHVRGAFASWPAQRRAPRRGAIRVRVGTPLTFQGVADDREGWDHVAASTRAAVEALAADDAERVSGSSRAP
jgi:hypothetical protein